jgi:hypothetical protein
MKRSITFTAHLIILLLRSLTAISQNSFTLSTPVIYSDVDIKDNSSPPTAINYKEYLSCTSLGHKKYSHEKDCNNDHVICHEEKLLVCGNTNQGKKIKKTQQ